MQTSSPLSSPQTPSSPPQLEMVETHITFKKNPDYVLVLLYILLYLELGWLIVMVWRSCY